MYRIREQGFVAYIVLLIIFLLFVLVVWLGIRVYSRYSSTFFEYYQLFLAPSSTHNPPSNLRFDSPPPVIINSPNTASSSAQPAGKQDQSAKSSPLPVQSRLPTITQPVRQAAPVPRAEPPVIAKTYKRSELNQGSVYVPVFTIFIEGKKQLWVMPSDGSVGIYGTFLATESSGMEVDRSADIVLGLTGGLKTGENKVNLLIKTGSNQLEVINSGTTILSIPVTITITE